MLSKDKIICAVINNIHWVLPVRNGFRLKLNDQVVNICFNKNSITVKDILRKKSWFFDEISSNYIMDGELTYYISYNLEKEIPITKEDYDLVEKTYKEYEEKKIDEMLLKLCGDEEKE